MFASLTALVSGLLLAPLPLRPIVSTPARSLRSPIPLAALDYKDPVVAAEFEKVQAVDIDSVEEELGLQGIVVPPTMNEVEMRLMLVEMRLRKSGKIGEQKKAAPAKPVRSRAVLRGTVAMPRRTRMRARGVHA